MQPKLRQAHNRSDIAGQRFGKLTVTEHVGTTNDRKALWSCKCDCGNTAVVRGSQLRSGLIRSCGCLRKQRRKWKGYGELSGRWWADLKRHAKMRGIEFNITIIEAWTLYQSQNGVCAISGVPLVVTSFNKKNRKDHTASLDRIDSSGIYEVRNVQWVHKDVNMLKRTFSMSELLFWCERIIQHARKSD